MRGLAALLFATASLANMLVDSAQLEKNLGRVTVVHVGSAESFATSHIAGAHFLDANRLAVARNGRTAELPRIDELQKLMEELGAGTRERIVIYGDEPQLATRLFWTLDYLGQGKRIAILDGGLATWTGPRASGAPDHKPKPFTARLAIERITLFTQLRAMKNATIVDARSAAEFAAGHIDGAIHIPPDASIDEVRGMMPAAPPAHVVVYCNDGLASTRVYFALRVLGYDPSLYDGGWEEWRDTPGRGPSS